MRETVDPIDRFFHQLEVSIAKALDMGVSAVHIRRALIMELAIQEYVMLDEGIPSQLLEKFDRKTRSKTINFMASRGFKAKA